MRAGEEEKYKGSGSFAEERIKRVGEEEKQKGFWGLCGR